MKDVAPFLARCCWFILDSFARLFLGTAIICFVLKLAGLTEVAWVYILLNVVLATWIFIIDELLK